ncbi:HAMP domain-containing histidine kinase [Sphingomonas sp. A2-49]|uniref:sensor histidine kinase n=1 Tax=Sphingomonas sp. A2-49 TaxID=1391375 RepID=UPI0021D20D41|nr:HAMP domain-containing sensor histidine kinase [Sphingomonas sp. A2-49]MCU6452494.1 HAMP domain-containing histidine kinase [Sphingomonas sp. A2-49]
MAVLIALALFVAQAVNLALMLRDRADFRLAQATRPVAIRVADAIDREAQGIRPIPRDRGRIRRADRDGIPAGLPRMPQIAAELRTQLHEQGVEVGRIDTGVRGWTAMDDAVLSRNFPRPSRQRRAADRPDQALLIAIEQPGRGWLAVIVPWGDGGTVRLFWRLFAQTLILYGVVLLPVLWIVRRISRPLRELTGAAQRFGRGGDAPAAVEVRGPADIASLVQSFNALQLRVTAMLDEKDRMLGAIGHDLRTPLAALRVRVESVEDETDRVRMTETIAEMNRTLDDILSLARMGRPSEPLTDVDLSALIDAVVEDFRDLGQDVSFDEAERLRMRLRPSLIRRAIRNLIENAVKYGGSATVRLVPGTTVVLIEVGDRGPGIPEARLADVFDAFTRLETSRNRDTGGIGLGLALARSIVREAGGDVRLANRDGGGLCATIELPR